MPPSDRYREFLETTFYGSPDEVQKSHKESRYLNNIAIIRAIGENPERYDMGQFELGMRAEREHQDVTGGDQALTAKIVIAHLKERADYYTQLKRIEKAKRTLQLLRKDR